MTRPLLAIFVACCGIGLAGCVPESGFVEIKRKVALHRDDVLMLNKTAVTEFRRQGVDRHQAAGRNDDPRA